MSEHPDNKIEQLQEMNDRLSAVVKDQIVTMQAAYIEWKRGKGAEAAMSWIFDGLAGSGLIPDKDDLFGQNAKLYYSAYNPNPLPICYCGMPSSVSCGVDGFCCEEHHEKAHHIEED